MKKKILSIGVLLIVLVVIISVMLVSKENNLQNKGVGNAVADVLRPKIKIDIVVDGKTETKTITTSRKYLADVLADEKLVSGEKGQYGLFVTEVSGIKADESKQQWWCITKNGKEVMEGISSIEINNGDKYELTLKTGYGK